MQIYCRSSIYRLKFFKMTLYNFKVNNWHNDIVDTFPRKPSKCDAVLKCEDGQVYLPRILLAISSIFWRDLLPDNDNLSDIVILIPDFKKETVQHILAFLKKGELTTDCCPRRIQEVIYFTQVLIPDIDIFSFEIEQIFNVESSNEETSGTESSEDNISNTFEGVEVGKTKEDRHACKFCLKFFVRKETLERHIKIIHMKTETCSCSICGKIFASKDGLKVHLKVHDEKNDVINRCPECQKVYTNSSDLDKHCKITGHQYQIKDSKKPYPSFELCNICHKWIGRKDHHMKKYHSSESRSFSCDSCDFTTNRSDTLYKHKKVSHNQYYRDFGAIKETLKSKDKFKCVDCGKKFTTDLELKDHVALQRCTDNNCSYCGKTFNVRHNLLQHVREVHEVNKQFECSLCTKLFNQKRNRDRHVKTCKELNVNK